ncbi:CGNR zinc finger domain-containing protein [Mycobacterium yunnanensis]|uniref:CGNR zinc finger domain-containing protein n=1 Tax=Mycobacterium yunnanensis TaxID=368477 RepID=A0A9X2YYY1_9MYCO|nr:CGNR zinc finger domain-containing protein [Mycobacterium yunnanensis]MCV7420106.1 CGNR zinc finger domain-containing protein [Mycobacterium yunnanensis]
MTTVSWLGDAEAKPAPGALRRVQALINTVDRESGQDRLAEAADAGPWLAANGLLGVGETLTRRDLDVVIAVREALRALVMHNAGGPPPDDAATAVLRTLADDGVVRVCVDGSSVSLTTDRISMRARLLALLLVIRDAQLDGTWGHLKTCANEACLWVFFDRSRNHGGTWCDMSTCGNKLKNRDFRARQRRSTP